MKNEKRNNKNIWIDIFVIIIVCVCGLVLFFELVRYGDGVNLTWKDGLISILSVLIITILESKNIIKKAYDNIEKTFHIMKGID